MWLGLGGGEVGDGVPGFGGPFAAARFAGAAGDLQGLGGVWERDAGGDGDDFKGALFDPAVGFRIGEVSGRDVGPGQRCQL